MTWNEEEHPRDEDGKFTFKNGGSDEEEKKEDKKETLGNQNSKMEPFKLGAEINVYKNEVSKAGSETEGSKTIPKTPAEILYRKTENQKKQREIENKYRNVLLDTLGKLATPAMVLLGTTKQLEDAVKENGLWDKVKESEMLQKITEKMIGGNYNKAKNQTAEQISGPDTAGMLDLAHGEENMNNPDYIKDSVKLENFNDPNIKEYREYLKEKIESQFKDYGYKAEDIKGYNFNENSKPSQRMAKNKDFLDMLAKNKENILSKKNFSINFPKHGPIGILKGNNFKNALGKADVKIEGIDKQGNLHLKVFDTYDFNKDAKDFLNKAGREEMEKGNSKPYFTIHDVLIPKDELDKIFSKENKE